MAAKERGARPRTERAMGAWLFVCLLLFLPVYSSGAEGGGEGEPVSLRSHRRPVP